MSHYGQIQEMLRGKTHSNEESYHLKNVTLNWTKSVPKALHQQGFSSIEPMVLTQTSQPLIELALRIDLFFEPYM